MIGATARVALADVVLLAVAAIGYVAGALSGAAAGVLLAIAAVLNIVWVVGVLVEGALSETKRR